MRTTGCCANTEPAVAEADGCVWMLNRAAGAELTLNMLLSALVIPLALAVSCLFVPAESICRSVNVATPFPALVPRSRVVVPFNGPVPELKVSVTATLPGRATVELFPNWSCVLMAGGAPNGAPAVAKPGWTENTNRFANPGLIEMPVEVTPASEPLPKLIVMLVATL